jgi:hypothetical protein
MQIFFFFFAQKMPPSHSITVQKSNQKIVEKETKSISLTHIIHERSISWHGTGNSILLKRGDCMNNIVSCFKLSFHKLDTYIYVYSCNQIKSSLTCKFSSFFCSEENLALDFEVYVISPWKHLYCI